jgi:hypothetical protein
VTKIWEDSRTLYFNGTNGEKSKQLTVTDSSTTKSPQENPNGERKTSNAYCEGNGHENQKYVFVLLNFPTNLTFSTVATQNAGGGGARGT